ncbi:MAG: ABC transporter substrate-binding protein [Chloroflexi bacterium]|nr:ABC transporter substrate-binding protein [Chloroflexota bacterium]
MVRKAFWLAASLLVVAVLLLVSCGPKAEPAPTPVEPIPATPTPATPTPAAPTPAAPTPAAPVAAPEQAAQLAKSVTPPPLEKPKYGGIISWNERNDIRTFDYGLYNCCSWGLNTVHEQLMGLDRTKSVYGTGDYDYRTGHFPFGGWGPILAESWEVPEPGTWEIKVRQGVHFGLDPTSEASRLVNGREYDVDDLILNFKRAIQPGSSTDRAQPLTARAATWEKTGPWSVTLKTPVDPFAGWCWVVYGCACGNFVQFPREVIQKYGSMQDWKIQVGTGPFFLSDYVIGNVITLNRNPNYWGTDNLGPGKGNQLPYVDTLKAYIISDTSTRIASLRTGKLDWDTEIRLEDAQTLLRSNPDIKYSPFILYSPNVVSARIDIPGKPFQDIRVRQALMMATDMEAIKNELYEGYAEINTFPASPVSKEVWVPMEKKAPEVQELYKYNPGKAKQLLAEAGYPNGFKTKMLVSNRSEDLDTSQILVAMWAKVGVEVVLDVKEYAVWISARQGLAYEDFALSTVGLIFPFGWNQNNHLRTNSSNIPRVNIGADGVPGSDPAIEGPHQEIQKYAFVNMDKAAEVYRTKLGPYLESQVYFIGLPSPYLYTIWQPWVKNYAGELDQSPIYGAEWLRYAWLDQDLKQKMTGRK